MVIQKKVIAIAQTYFAIQTRKMELTEREYSSLTEEEKRFYQDGKYYEEKLEVFSEFKSLEKLLSKN